VRAEALELVALHNPSPGSRPMRHTLRDAQGAEQRTFAYLVLRLPSDQPTGSMSMSQGGKLVACAGKLGDLGMTAAVAYADCECWLACAAPGYAIFAVYALRITGVRPALRLTNPRLCLVSYSADVHAAQELR
jgi:hypothetical protein